ncbi:MAG: zinc-binding dehydrogenase [Phycisphaeraceae bacterium]
MKSLAAILVELGRPLELVSLEVPALKPGQVLVEVGCSGVCHTQVLEVRGHRGKDPYVPHCLGHEGAGTVLEIGAGVSKVKVGQRVILSWIKGGGADVPGTVYQAGGQAGGRAVNAGAVTTFQTHALVSENRLTPLRNGAAALSFGDAAMLGCALPTGLGAVFNTARPSPGQSLAVLGAGGVGLCAIMGAVTAGCYPVIAVDINPHKLQVARQLGATHTINPSQEKLADAVAAATSGSGGLDFAIEATGRPEVMRQALELVRMRGGTAVVIGNARADESLSFDPKQLNLGKRLLGTWGGDSDPDRDYPRYANLVTAGRLSLTPLKSEGYTLERINEALDDLESGRAVRPLVTIKKES